MERPKWTAEQDVYDYINALEKYIDYLEGICENHPFIYMGEKP